MKTSAREVTIVSTYKVNYSYEVLIKVAEWLIKRNKIKIENCPVDLAKSKRYLINTKPKHKDGSDFIQWKRLSNGLYIETKYSTIGCKEYARRLLEKYGDPEDTLKEVKIMEYGVIYGKSKEEFLQTK